MRQRYEVMFLRIVVVVLSDGKCVFVSFFWNYLSTTDSFKYNLFLFSFKLIHHLAASVNM
jgi:hypothetical protein